MVKSCFVNLRRSDTWRLIHQKIDDEVGKLFRKRNSLFAFTHMKYAPWKYNPFDPLENQL